MSRVEMRDRLIDKIQKTQDRKILEEVYKLLDLRSEESEIYKLNEEQKKANNLARHNRL